MVTIDFTYRGQGPGGRGQSSVLIFRFLYLGWDSGCELRFASSRIRQCWALDNLDRACSHMEFWSLTPGP